MKEYVEMQNATATETGSAIPLNLSAAEAADMRDRGEDLTIIDVRTPAEFESAHISGSFNVPLDLLPEHAEQIGSAVGGTVALVCQSGVRAKQAERHLLRAELPRLHILDGGISAWERQGLPLVRGQQRWSLERQVRGVAGSLVLVGALGGLFIRRPIGLLSAAIGGGLTFSALSNTCGMGMLLSKLPYNRGATCDIDSVISALDKKSSSAPSS